MKKSKKITTKPKQARSISRKNPVNLSSPDSKKSAQKSLPAKKVPHAERRRFNRRASDIDKFRDQQGKIIRKQAGELEIKNFEAKEWANKEILAEEQIHVRTKAMDSAIDGIFIIDVKNPRFLVVYANASYCNIIGYSKREIVGHNYFLHYGADADLRILNEIKETINQGRSFTGELLNFRKNGEKFWSFLRLTSVRDGSGDITHYVGIKTDTTLVKQKNVKIEEQREELLHVTRVGKLAEFVSSLAHEISQPLTAILSYAQAAQRMFKDREPQLQEILQYIINDNQRASEVIRRLRSLLKKNKPTMEAININILIQDTIMLILTNITVRNKVVKVDLDSSVSLIQGDRIQLQQVLLNLISNSLEAMEGSASRDMLIMTSRQDADTILVQVKDSGCGIPEKNMKKLFTHFFTSKPDGLGMGLSISRSIIEAHGGCLEAKNNRDRGATFYFTLPVNGKKDS